MNKQQRIERLELALGSVSAKSERLTSENDRLNESILRTYRLLEAERDDLLARAAKLNALMKTLGARIHDDGSPSNCHVMSFTGKAS